MDRCVPSPQILVTRLTINVQRSLHVYLWSMAMNVIVLWVKRAKTVKKVSTNQVTQRHSK